MALTTDQPGFADEKLTPARSTAGLMRAGIPTCLAEWQKSDWARYEALSDHCTREKVYNAAQQRVTQQLAG
jgi:hypothetical protein